MALQKQNINLSFANGVDTKTDPWQLPVGTFLSLNNMIFTKGKRLTKRNGYGSLIDLPELATFLTTFNHNLTAVGSSLQAFSDNTNEWINKGSLQPVSLSTLPLIRSNTNQSQADTAISPNGLVCTVYTDQTPTSLSTPRYLYAIADVTTGQNIIQPTLIPPLTGVITGSPRVFVMGSYFVIVFTNVITATSHLQYIAISYNNISIVTTNVDIASSYDSSSGLSWDGVVTNNSLYIAYNTSAGGQSIKIRYLSPTLTLSSITTYSDVGKVKATLMSVSADTTGSSPIIYAAYYDDVSDDGYVFSVDTNLNKVLITPVQIINNEIVDNITSVASNSQLRVYYEIDNNYTFDSSIPTHYIKTVPVTSAGVVGSNTIVVRSVGLASKAFIIDGIDYFLTSYQSIYQPTYFLMNMNGKVISRLAYSNGGGYDTLGLPSVTVNSNIAQIAYLIKDFITSQNTSLTESVTKSNIYSQTGINLVSFSLGTTSVVPVEIAQTLNLSGGFLWEYDGYIPVEQNFLLWPDSVEGSPVNSGGAMPSQTYQYQVVYTWTNNQGNIERSAPSIAVTVDMSAANLEFAPPTPITTTADLVEGSPDITVTSATGLVLGQYVTDTTTGANIQANSYIINIAGFVVTLNLPATATVTADAIEVSTINSVTLNIPTLRLTYKTSNPVKIEIFRFSTAQQLFYQVTSILQPLINSVTVDYVTYTDTKADNQILGNSLIYTTGGVIENIGAPSFNAMTLFDNRLWGIAAEDPNLLWYSKQVIETTPVEMSDLFTIYVAPSTASQGSTGNMKCLAPLDDKLIIFKPNALYYINGTGPNNTGANSQYSEPIFVTSVVGSSNQQSIVFMPDGLMFQSDKGIWLLGRGMDVSYIGAPVEIYTQSALVQSAVSVPGTTQVRFTLSSGITLMYDYFYKQWGSFVGVPAISSTLYQDRHTFVNSHGMVYQETPGLYLDGTTPVTMSFTTSWINMAGLQGYQRSYFFYMLGQYVTPHFLNVGIAYDYDPAITQSSTITPHNFSPAYGVSSPYGQQTPYGFPGDVEQWRIFFANQRCQAFQLTIQEIYDSSLGVPAGEGLRMSGLDILISTVRPFRAGPVPQTIGGGVNGSNN